MNHRLSNSSSMSMLVGALACLSLAGAAQAGAVSTSFDPLFGSALPDLSYSGGLAFNVRDSCLGASSDGLRSVNLNGSCRTTASASLKLFDAGLPGQSGVEAVFDLAVRNLTLLNDVVVGWETNTIVFSDRRTTNALARLVGASVYGSNPYINVDAAEDNDFSFKYAVGGVPQLTCLYCNGNFFDYVRGGYLGADGEPGFVQLINYTDDSGQAFKVKMTLDGTTPQYAIAVPEPGSIALLAAGFAALALTRRRKG